MGIPRLRENDRFSGYLDNVLDHVRAALEPFASFEIVLSNTTSKPGIEGIVECQNDLISRALAGNYDYLWLVQGDVEVPREAFYRLYMLDVDVAQGVVRRHDGDGLICGFMDEKAKVWYLPRNAVAGQILSGWVFAGMSCTLIKRRVLESGIRFRYQPGIGEDILFMFDVQKAGFVAEVHGDVLCGHLPEWPLAAYTPGQIRRHEYDVLDVGCGHRPKGNVNVDLFPDPSAHRCVDQRVNDDVPLKVHEIPNFVRADACHLPFRDGAFEGSYSWHLIEHVQDPNLFLSEILRVSAEKVEVRCPNGEFLLCKDETKPLHLHDFSLDWFRETLKVYPDWDFSVRWDYSQSEPLEIVVEGVRKDEFAPN